MIYISIAFTLVALVAGMYLLAKAKRDGLGKSYSWISYIVIVTSLALLLCQLTQGVMRMMACRGENREEMMMERECGPHDWMMMHHGWMHGHGRCMEDMEMCKTKSDSGCCMKRGCEGDEE